MIYRQIDSTFATTECDLVSSFSVAKIGAVAFTVWSVIKYSADFQTGESFHGLRDIGEKIGMSKDSVNRAVDRSLEALRMFLLSNINFSHEINTEKLKVTRQPYFKTAEIARFFSGEEK